MFEREFLQLKALMVFTNFSRGSDRGEVIIHHLVKLQPTTLMVLTQRKITRDIFPLLKSTVQHLHMRPKEVVCFLLPYPTQVFTQKNPYLNFFSPFQLQINIKHA